MNKNHLNELKTLEEEYWWHVAKRRLLEDYLTERFQPPAKIVEAGVGAGGNLRHFKRMGYSVQGYELMPEAVEYAHSTGLDEVSLQDVSKPWSIEDGSVDIVVMMDVLEHLDHPETALGSARQALTDDGALILSVPACPSLMGPWDVALGHKRRYSLRSLRGELERAGFHEEHLAYWNLFTLPAALLVRGFQRLNPTAHSSEFPRVPGLLNKALILCADLERVLFRKNPIYYGLSIMGIFRKK